MQIWRVTTPSESQPKTCDNKMSSASASPACVIHPCRWCRCERKTTRLNKNAAFAIVGFMCLKKFRRGEEVWGRNLYWLVSSGTSQQWSHCEIIILRFGHCLSYCKLSLVTRQEHDNGRLWTCVTVRRRTTVLEPRQKISPPLVIFGLGQPNITQYEPGFRQNRPAEHKMWTNFQILFYLTKLF